MIGTNNNYPTSTLQIIVKYIKNITKKYLIDDTIVLYGGSVNNINAKDILDITDGVLVGNASLDINQLMKIIEVTKK